MLETTVRGTFAALHWCCKNCGNEWAVTSEEEQVDRRFGPADRRTDNRAPDRRRE